MGAANDEQPDLEQAHASAVPHQVSAGLLQDKRAALIAACRQALGERIGGEAALPTNLNVRLRRTCLLQDTWQVLVERPVSELVAPCVFVEFEGEEGIDSGGVTRDWFDAVGRMVAEDSAAGRGLMALAPDRSLMPRTVLGRSSGASDSKVTAQVEADHMLALLALGRFLAIALLCAKPLPLSLSSVVCKYLLQSPISMDDVRRLDGEFFRGRVEPMLRPDGLAKLEAALGAPLAFVAAAADEGDEPEELIPGGAHQVVTESNKVQYLRLLCEAYVCGGARREIQCLLQGFWDVLPPEMLKEHEVGPGELAVLISGVHDVDAEDWFLHTSGPEDDMVFKWFWEIVREDLGAEERCLLLHFVTGSSRLPPGGFAKLEPMFSIDVMDSRSQNHLPHAHTCINKLVLQRYCSRKQLSDKLLQALSAEGFGFA